MKVFIADDSALVRERLITMLTDVPEIEIVGEAEDVPTAITAIQRAKPDVVVLDIRMPGGSGIDVLSHVNKVLPKVVVIILTNYPQPQYRKKCMELGARFFFDKATEFEKVPRVIKELIESSE
ncbi:response regulator transcription factor [Candidatus Sumerlaeota bacterium]|nr:response regulator transcription factor [Candidatus Sumerlaeota bacterium]